MSDIGAARAEVSQVPTTTGGMPEAEAPEQRERSASLWADARRQLMRSPVFLIASGYILIVISMALLPFLWTRKDPRACDVVFARQGPSAEHWFGTSIVGCDYYAHAIYGARTSLIIAVC